MLRLGYALCILGAAVPVVLTGVELIVVVLIEGFIHPLHAHAILRAICGIAIAVLLGFSVANLSGHVWAMWTSAIVSGVWLYLAFWTIFDLRVHPAKWERGDGAEGVLLLLPFGLIGLLSATVMLGKKWRERRAYPQG